MHLNTSRTLYPADKQCSWQCALHFGIVQFPGGVENAQNDNFFKNFEMQLLRMLGTKGSLYVVNACSTVRISNVVHYMLSISCS